MLAARLALLDRIAALRAALAGPGELIDTTEARAELARILAKLLTEKVTP